jgi:hypothetical protein
MWAIVRDITDRKQVEKALRECADRYRLAANNIPDIIYSIKKCKGETMHKCTLVMPTEKQMTLPTLCYSPIRGI